MLNFLYDLKYNKKKIVKKLFIILLFLLILFSLYLLIFKKDNFKNSKNINKDKKINNIVKKEPVNIYKFKVDNCSYCKDVDKLIKNNNNINIVEYDNNEYNNLIKKYYNIDNNPYLVVGDLYINDFNDKTKVDLENKINSEYKKEEIKRFDIIKEINKYKKNIKKVIVKDINIKNTSNTSIDNIIIKENNNIYKVLPLSSYNILEDNKISIDNILPNEEIIIKLEAETYNDENTNNNIEVISISNGNSLNVDIKNINDDINIIINDSNIDISPDTATDTIIYVIWIIILMMIFTTFYLVFVKKGEIK